MYAATYDPEESCDFCVWPLAEDESAFHTIVDRYGSRVSRIALGITGNALAAEEIARNVFARAYLAGPGLASRTPLFPWIYRIAVDECYTFLNRRPLTKSTPVSTRNAARSQTGFSLNCRKMTAGFSLRKKSRAYPYPICPESPGWTTGR